MSTLSCHMCRSLMRCTAEESKLFREKLGLAIANNSSLVEEDHFCRACFEELKEVGNEKRKQQDAPKEPPVQHGININGGPVYAPF